MNAINSIGRPVRSTPRPAIRIDHPLHLPAALVETNRRQQRSLPERSTAGMQASVSGSASVSSGPLLDRA
jgi:hypothetical protein